MLLIFGYPILLVKLQSVHSSIFIIFYYIIIPMFSINVEKNNHILGTDAAQYLYVAVFFFKAEYFMFFILLNDG